MSARKRPSIYLAFATLFLLLGAARWSSAQDPIDQRAQDSPMQFSWIDVHVDVGDRPLAAYQFELNPKSVDFQIVGVEGGEHTAFEEPPYYDADALSQNRIVIAAYNVGDDLPIGKTRVARIHISTSVGEQKPKYRVKLIVAASPDGGALEGEISIEEGSAE